MDPFFPAKGQATRRRGPDWPPPANPSAGDDVDSTPCPAPVSTRSVLSRIPSSAANRARPWSSFCSTGLLTCPTRCCRGKGRGRRTRSCCSAATIGLLIDRLPPTTPKIPSYHQCLLAWSEFDVGLVVIMMLLTYFNFISCCCWVASERFS